MIGAGQAGLAMGYQLKKTGRSFLMVDGVAEVGDSWRLRYDTLTLFTTRDMSTLPGGPVDGDQESYMTQKGIRQLHEGVCRAVPPADPAQDAHHQAGKVDADWVQIPNTKDERGKYLHHRGVSPAENLFFMGRPWQTCRASALISGLERDSAMILGKLPPVPPQLASAAAE